MIHEKEKIVTDLSCGGHVSDDIVLGNKIYKLEEIETRNKAMERRETMCRTCAQGEIGFCLAEFTFNGLFPGRNQLSNLSKDFFLAQLRKGFLDKYRDCGSSAPLPTSREC